MKQVKPVKGAADYTTSFSEGKWRIWMTDTDGHTSAIDTALNEVSAWKKTDKWQKKENEAVLKSND